MPAKPWFTEALAIWLAARYFVAVRKASQGQGQEDWRLLRQLCADVVELRRGDHRAQRLRLARQKLEFQRQRKHDKPPGEQTPLPPKVISGEVAVAGQPRLVLQGASTTVAAQAQASSTQQAPATPPQSK